MIEKFKDIFKGLERAHGCTKVGPDNNDGEKVKGKSFVVREPVTDELWLTFTRYSKFRNNSN